jgi:RNA recognition motif-containing protein
MAIRLYVGNLPYEVNDEKLREIFSPFGQVTSATIIINKFNNRSKGFGFVEFAEDASAREAIEKLNDSEVGDRKIVVNEAKPREERPSNGGFQNRSRGGYNSYR